MAPRKSFPLRLPPELYGAVRRWAEDELRSVNGQIEYLLLSALRKAGRWPPRRPSARGEGASPGADEGPDRG